MSADGPLTDATSQEDFRAALSLWASGVAVVTTADVSGRHWGFTASAFSSVSLNPPLVLVCLSGEADCHDAFVNGAGFAVNILRSHHRDLALQFATKTADKFQGTSFVAGERGSPVLPDALATIECIREETITAGDHTILIGLVVRASSDPARSAQGSVMLHVARRFRTVAAEPLQGFDVGPDLPWFS